MSSDLSLYRPGGLARGEARATRRELARLEAKAQAVAGRVELQADLQVARVQSVAHVTRQALLAAALVTELEVQLGQVVPEARGRLQGIGNIGALGLAQVVSDTVEKVNR